MAENLQNYLQQLENDPGNKDLISKLEEAVVDQAPEGDDAEMLADAIETLWRRISSEGFYSETLQLIETELMLVHDEMHEAALYEEQASIYREHLFDDEEALERLRKALALAPDNESIEERISDIKEEKNNWSGIVTKYEEEAQSASDNGLKASLLNRAASLVYRNSEDTDRVVTLLKQSVDINPADERTTQFLEKILVKGGKWPDLAELYARIAVETRDSSVQIDNLIKAAETHSTKLDNPLVAARFYSQVLDIQPGNEKALDFVVPFFEEKEEWEQLLDIYEKGLNSSSDPERGKALLAGIGKLKYRNMDNFQAAEDDFRKLRKIDPASPDVLDYYRAYAEKEDDWNRLIQVLTEAQRAVQDAETRESLSREIANISAQRTGNTDKAIEAWKSVLKTNPDDAEARETLKDLYRKGEKWNALIEILKAESESIDDDQTQEKVAVLKEMVAVYRDKLNLEVMVINTYNAIVSLDPGDSEAVDALMEMYEKLGRWNDLVKILETMVSQAEDKEEKITLLMRLVRLWIDRFSNLNKAVEPLEQILEIDPANPEAGGILKNIYEKRRAWKPLLDLYGRELEFMEGTDKVNRLIEMARLYAEKLSKYEEAAELWRKVLDEDPEHDEALSTLEWIAERKRDYNTLAEVLEKRYGLIQDEEESLALLEKLGSVYKDRLGKPAESARVWKRIVKLRPDHAKAVRMLRDSYLAADDFENLEELYSDREDWEGLVEVLGTAADNTDDNEVKIKLSFRVAELYRERIGQPERGLRSYERILSVDPQNLRAARELVPIYRREERWNRLLNVYEILLENEENDSSKLEMMKEVRDLAVEKMGNRQLAFTWAGRVFDLNPQDEQARSVLETTADSASKWSELFDIYKNAYEKMEGEGRLDLERRAAGIAAEKLGDIEGAVEIYQRLLNENPGDQDTLVELDKLYRTTGQWNELAGIYRVRIKSTSKSQRRDLVVELARLCEDALDNPEAAVRHYQDALELNPGDEEILMAMERLATLEERWEDLAALLEMKREYSEGAQKASADFQLASLFMDRLERFDSALELFAEILEIEPGHEEAMSAMEPLLEIDSLRTEAAQLLQHHLRTMEKWHVLAGVLDILIADEKKKKKRLRLRLDLADIARTKLNDDERAFRVLCDELEEYPQDENLWDMLQEVSLSLGNWSDLATVLKNAYESAQPEGEKRKKFASTLARIFEERIFDSAGAARFHSDVLEIDPDSEEAFVALENHYSAEEDWTRLLALYENLLGSVEDDDNRLSIMLKCSFVEEEILGDSEAAIARYIAVLEIDPSNAQAYQALSGLYENTGRWNEFASLVEKQIEMVEEPEQVPLIFRLGEILEDHLDDVNAAVDHYERVLEVDPQHVKAAEALEKLLSDSDLRLRVASVLRPIYENQGASANLVKVLDVQLGDPDLDSDGKVDLLLNVADLHERRLGDAQAAFDALSSAFSTSPENETVRGGLSRLSSEQGMHLSYAGLLCNTVENIDDRILAGDLLSEAAGLFDENVDDREKAEQTYRRLIDLDPERGDTVVPATVALERIYSDQGAWKNMVEILRIRAGFQENLQVRKETLQRVAEIQEAMLDDAEAALETYVDLEQLDPVDTVTLGGMERLYSRTENWSRLIDVLKTRVTLSESSAERRDINLRVAELYETRTDDLSKAVEAYREALQEGGPDRNIYASMSGLLEKLERWPDLLEILDANLKLAEDDSERIEAIYKMATINLKLMDYTKAAERLGEVLEIDSTHAGAKEALDEMLKDPASRSTAVGVLTPIAEREQDHERLIELALIEAEDADEPSEKSTHLKRAAGIAEHGLGDMEKAYSLLSKAVLENTGDPEAGILIDELERISEAVDGYSSLVDVFKQVSPDVLDGDLQTRLYRRIAELSRYRLQDIETAREYFVKVLDNAGDDIAAMQALEEIYRETEAYVDLLEIYRRQLDTAETTEARVDILKKQAALSEGPLDDISGATICYESVLAEVEDSDAAVALERLYEKTERWADLSALLEREIELPGSDAVELRYRLGMLHMERLHDVDMALEHFSQVLQVDNNHQPAITALEGLLDDEERRSAVAGLLEPIYTARMDWPKLVDVIEARLSGMMDPLERKPLLMKIGMMYEEQLEDLDAAFGIYGRIFTENIEDPEPRELLFRLAGVLDAWDRFAELISTALEDVVGDTPETADLAFQLGEIYESRLSKMEEARNAYARVLEFSPENRNAFSALERLYLQDEMWPELIAHYRTAADMAMEDEVRVDYLSRIGNILEENMEEYGQAIEVYEEVLALDPRRIAATASLDRLYASDERWGDLTDLLRREMDVAETSEARHDLMCRLGRLHEEKMEDIPGAIDCYEEVINENPAQPEALSALEQLVVKEENRYRVTKILEPIYRDADEWKKLVVIYDAQLEFIQDKIERVQRLREIADIHESRGGDTGLAFEALARAFIEEPADESVLEDIRRITESLGNWQGMVTALKQGLENIYDIDAKVNVLKIIGSTEEQRLNSQEGAIDTYREVIELDEQDTEALDALEALYNMSGEWEGLVDILERKAMISMDEAVRVEFMRRIGAIYEDMLSNTDEAIDAYTRAIDISQEDSEALSALERLYLRSEQWNELVEVYRRRLDLAAYGEEKRDILVSIATTCETRLDDRLEAIRCYRQILEEIPDDREAVQSLSRLYRQEEMFHELMENLELEYTLAQSDEEKVGLLSRTGDLLSKDMNDPLRAVEKYSEALQIDATNEQIISALVELAQDETARLSVIEVLEPVFREHSRWEDLAGLMELKVEATEDPHGRVEELLALADIQESGMGDASAAFGSFVRALREDPGSDVVRDSLDRLAAQLGIFSDLAASYEETVQELYDSVLQYQMLMHLGKMYEEQLGDPENAVSAYNRALETGAGDEDSLASLDRLYWSMENWEALAEILERRIAVEADGAQVIEFELRLSDLRERQFNDFAGALDACRSVVEKDPRETRAVECLERLLDQSGVRFEVIELLDDLYQQRNEPEKRARLYEMRIEDASADLDRVQLLKDLAVLREETLNDTSSAFDTYGRAIVLMPEDESIIREMERLAETLGSWQGLAQTISGVLENPELDPQLATSFRLRIAGWQIEKLGDPATAEQTYRAILESDPEHEGALSALEDVLMKLGRFEDVLEVMNSRAAVIYDMQERREKLSQAARLAISELGMRERAAGFYEAVLEIDDSDTEALDMLADHAESMQEWSKMVDLLDRRAGATMDGLEANRFRHRAAVVASGPMEDEQRAVDLYNEILNNDPVDTGAVAALEGIYEKAGRWEDLADILQRKMDQSSDTYEITTIRKTLAKLYEERFENMEDALDEWRSVIMENPSDPDAAAAMERIYTSAERWNDLEELLQESVSRQREAGNVEEELRLLVRIGELWDQKLGDTARAVEIYEQVLQERPGHTRALAALARLHETQGDWEKCAEVLRQAAEGAEGGADAAEVHFRIGRLEMEHGSGVDAAEQEFLKARNFDPSHVETAKQLGEIYRQKENHAGLVEMLEVEQSLIDDTERKVQLLVEVSSIRGDELNDPAGAVAVLEQAKDLDPGNTDILLKLSDIYLKAGREMDAVPVLEKLIEEETQGGKKRSKKAAVYLHRLAKARRASGDLMGAMQSYEEAYKIDLSNPEVLSDLGQLYYENDDLEKATRVFRALLLQRGTPDGDILGKADVYWYLGDILEKQGEDRKAKGMYQRGLEADPNDDRLKQAVERLK